VIVMKNKIANVLMIEDDPVHVILIQEYFEKINNKNKYEITLILDYVDTLSKGLVRYEKGDFDLILLDLGLPDGSGMTIVDQIRDKGITKPIIIFTAYKSKNFAIDAKRKGVMDYLVKGEIDCWTLFNSMLGAMGSKNLQE